MRGWLPLYTLSWRLGARYLLRRGFMREAVIRLVVPLDPGRYLELPQTLRDLGARPGERVLDLASPKLPAVALAGSGVDVVSVDANDAEVAAWRELAADEPRVRFEVGDGRALDHADASFDHAYSISVIEHIEDDGDEPALRELARVVRPGGRVVVTVPYASRYFEDWRDEPLYGGAPAQDGRYFFERWYDEDRLQRLIAAAPELRLCSRQVTRLQPNWHRVYMRTFPWILVLGPFFGLLAREREGPPGDVARLCFERS